MVYVNVQISYDNINKWIFKPVEFFHANYFKTNDDFICRTHGYNQCNCLAGSLVGVGGGKNISSTHVSYK